jgi:hypothetical protein
MALGTLRLCAGNTRPGSLAWLDSGIWGVRLGRLADGGIVGPARAGLPWLAGLVDDVVAPVRIGSGRTLRFPVATEFCPVCCAGLKRPGSFLAFAGLGHGLLFWHRGFQNAAGIGCWPVCRVATGLFGAGPGVVCGDCRMCPRFARRYSDGTLRLAASWR